MAGFPALSDVTGLGIDRKSVVEGKSGGVGWWGDGWKKKWSEVDRHDGDTGG